MFGGWELPTTHCMINEVLRGRDRTHGTHRGQTVKQARKPLSWPLLLAGRQAVFESQEDGCVVWCSFALSYFLLCRAGKLFAYDDPGLAHRESWLTRRNITFCQDPQTLLWKDREKADWVTFKFRGGKNDQYCQGASVTRTRSAASWVPDGWSSLGALTIVLLLLRCHPSLPLDAPFTTRVVGDSWVSTTRARATSVPWLMVASAEGGRGLEGL